MGHENIKKNHIPPTDGMGSREVVMTSLDGRRKAVFPPCTECKENVGG